MRAKEFLCCDTPVAWLEQAVDNLDTLLIDHANCEKKAAGNALNLLYRHVEHTHLLLRLSKLAREELRHFEQVLQVMRSRGIRYRHVSASRYAGMLREQLNKMEPQRLIDTLIVGAIVEARSCERFASLVPVLDLELGQFYAGLQASEARHFEVYLALARKVADQDIEARVDQLLEIEAELITTRDPDFRFHSGVPG
jgi:tRNA 2-(methylsulfanyl)-N6-isopentenyladenosine37 hydroxylase